MSLRTSGRDLRDAQIRDDAFSHPGGHGLPIETGAVEGGVEGLIGYYPGHPACADVVHDHALGRIEQFPRTAVELATRSLALRILPGRSGRFDGG